MLGMLATLLKVPELATPDFDECLVDYTLEGYRLTTPRVSLKGTGMQVSATGSLNLANSTLDYNVNLALAESLLARIPIQELRPASRSGVTASRPWTSGSTARPRRRRPTSSRASERPRPPRSSRTRPTSC